VFVLFQEARAMAKRHGAEYWRRHLEAWDRSELTQREYCLANGLSVESLRRWRRRAQDGLDVKSPLTLVAARVSSPVSEGVVRLHSPGGWGIEVPLGSVSWLGEWLRQLP
jgi:hypothetical protein